MPPPARATDAPNEDGFAADATLNVDLEREAATLVSPRIWDSLVFVEEYPF